MTVYTLQTENGSILSAMDMVAGFGAVADGKFDNAALINNAIAFAQSNGIGALVFPPGTYNIRSTLTIASSPPIALLGSGAGSTIIRAAVGSESIAMLVIGDGVTTCSDVIIQDIQFSSVNQKTANAAIKLQKCFRTHLERIRTQNQFRGIHVFNSTETWLRDSDLRDSSENAFVFECTLNNGNDCYLNNVVADNPDITNAGAGILWLGGENLVVHNVDFIHFVEGLSILPPNGQQCRWGFFSAAEFDTCSDNNIKVTNSAGGNVIAMTFVNGWTGTATNYGVLVDGSGTGLLQGVRFIGHKSLHNGLAGFRLTGGAQDVHINGCDIIGNSQTSSNTRSGIEVASTMGSDWSIIGCRCTNGWQQGSTQQYGINTDAATYTNAIIANNDVTGNATGGINLNGATFTGGQVKNNQGYNPKGNFTAPGIPASTTPFTNNTGYDCVVFITGGTVSSIAIGGVATGVTLATSGSASN